MIIPLLFDQIADWESCKYLIMHTTGFIYQYIYHSESKYTSITTFTTAIFQSQTPHQRTCFLQSNTTLHYVWKCLGWRTSQYNYFHRKWFSFQQFACYIRAQNHKSELKNCCYLKSIALSWIFRFFFSLLIECEIEI